MRLFSRSTNPFQTACLAVSYRSLAVHSAIQTDIVRNIFAWEVTYLKFVNEMVTDAIPYNAAAI